MSKKYRFGIVILATLLLAALFAFAPGALADEDIIETTPGDGSCQDGKHNWVEDTTQYVPETCFSSGKRIYNCACGAKGEQTIPATGNHTWDEGTVTTEATCGAVGEKTFTCTVTGCGATKPEEIPATGKHTWDEGKVTTEASCGAVGEKTFTCSVCGQTKGGNSRDGQPYLG